MASLSRIACARDLTEQVYQRLLHAICDGELAPGARLTQDELAAALAISRQRVLQALRLLKKDGFVIDAGRSGSAGGDSMKLMQEQLEQFDRDGYLFFPSLFTPAEIRVLIDEVPRLYAQRRPENVREKGSDAVRTNFAAHMYSYPFARLARHPRMVKPVMQIFGEPVYMHQFKINGKMAFEGDLWQWHQDYGTWKNDDLMPEARAMNVAIFLDEVNEFNGPLMFIPGSHKLGVLDAEHDVMTTSYPLWTITHDTIRQLIERGGIVAPKGPSGSMILFHGCLVHASTANLSPWNRVSVYLSLCAVSNHIRRFKRPEYIAHRDFTPIQCLPDDCLLRDYDVPLPWKDGTPESALQPMLAS